MSQAVLAVSAVMLALVVLAYGLKALRHPGAVVHEWNHPVRIAFFPAISISLLLFATALVEPMPVAAHVIWWIGTLLQGGLALAVISAWIGHRPFQPGMMTPAWFIPAVGNVIVPLAGVRLGHPEISWLFFSGGLVFWVVLLTLVMNRLMFHDPLPGKMLPTLMILIAPPAVAFSAWLRLEEVPGPFGHFLLSAAYVFALVVVTQVGKFRRMPFALSWWALSFPLAALAIASFGYAHAAGSAAHRVIGAGLLALLVAVVAVLIGRTAAGDPGGHDLRARIAAARGERILARILSRHRPLRLTSGRVCQTRPRRGGPTMDHFLYRDGSLWAEDVPVARIAAEVGSPVYIYSAATLLRHYGLFEQALAGMPHLVCFAMKALGNLAVLKLLGDRGAGVDVVSGGEYRKARAAGIPGDRIVFSGVGKTAEEMRLALEGGIRQFNVESEPEMERLNAVALSLGIFAPITIRVNPDVDAKTHAKIATGKSENKFGIPIARARAVYAHAARLPGLKRRRHRRAYRQPVDRPCPVPRGLRQDRRAGAGPAGRRPRHHPAGPGRRPWHPLHRQQRGAAPADGLRRDDPGRGRPSGLRDRDRAGAPDRRERGHPRQRGDLRESTARAGIS